MTRALRSEWVALTTTRALLGHLLAAVVLGLLPLLILPVVAQQDISGPGVPDLATEAGQAGLLTTASTTLLLAAVLGAVVSTRRHRHRTAVAQLLATPDRTVAASTQLVVLLAAGALLGLVGVGVTLAATVGGLALVGESLAVGGDLLVRLLLGGIAAGVVGAALGDGVGELLRSSGAAIAVIVVLLFLVEGLLGAFLPEVGRWLPSTLLTALQLGDAAPLPNPVGDGPALAALSALVVVSAAAAVVSTTRRDAL